MFEDIFDIFKMILSVAIAITLVGVIFVSIYYFSGAYELNLQKEQELHDCYIQEPRSKECNYIIWQYEIKNAKERTRRHTLVIPMVMR